MIGEKVKHFEHKSTDLSALQAHIESYLQSDGFTVQASKPSSHGTVVQAKKGGFLRGVVDADRALSILISGDPDDFVVRVGIGKWAEHLAVAVVETLLIGEIFLVIDVAESAWNIEIEDRLVKDMEAFIG